MRRLSLSLPGEIKGVGERTYEGTQIRDKIQFQADEPSNLIPFVYEVQFQKCSQASKNLLEIKRVESRMRNLCRFELGGSIGEIV